MIQNLEKITGGVFRETFVECGGALARAKQKRASPSLLVRTSFPDAALAARERTQGANERTAGCGGIKRTRWTPNINLASAENAIQATGFADSIGLPLNRHLTVCWEHAQCIGRVQDIQGRFLELFSKWIRYHGSTAVYVWSIENGRVKGYHSHIFVHVPQRLLKAFRRRVPKWIDGDVEQSGRLQTFKITTIKYGAGVRRFNCLKGVTRYILKAANDDAAELFGIIQRPDKAGIVAGKRVGTSQNIGRKARHENLTKPYIEQKEIAA